MIKEIEEMQKLCETDETVREAVRQSKSYDEVIAIAANHGITLQESDFMAKRSEGTATRALDENELAAVAGGGCDDYNNMLTCLIAIGSSWW